MNSKSERIAEGITVCPSTLLDSLTFRIHNVPYQHVTDIHLYGFQWYINFNKVFKSKSRYDVFSFCTPVNWVLKSILESTVLENQAIILSSELQISNLVTDLLCLYYGPTGQRGKWNLRLPYWKWNPFDLKRSLLSSCPWILSSYCTNGSSC